MYQSNRSLNIPPGNPPGQPPRHLNFWRLACSNSLPSGQKSRSNAPPFSSEILPLKDKFRLQSNTVHTFQREICWDVTFRLLLKTLLKEIFTNLGETLSCKSVKPCKNQKNWQEYYTRTRDKSISNSPPFQGNVQTPPIPGTMHSQMPGVCPGGGCLSFNLTGVRNVHWTFWSDLPSSLTSTWNFALSCFSRADDYNLNLYPWQGDAFVL